MLYESLLFLEGQLNKYFGKLHLENESIFLKPAKLENIAALKGRSGQSRKCLYYAGQYFRRNYIKKRITFQKGKCFNSL